MQKTKIENPDKTVGLLFEDEASFGRINKPKCCWCNNKFRPCVPCHHIREYRYAFGAVEPLTGERFFLVMPNCNTNNMSIFLKELSKTYSEDIMILVCDGAAWHKSKNLEISENIIITHIPPYTPEMNPIEQIWKQIRQMGFGNKIFRILKCS
ncbi:transposase [Leptotrichia wadei]|uniref:Transposase n=1 Tax=Leptotrichia wadei TaxID=157687 RepID=A0A133ZYC0_9FUSO|nr:IS630 family transposase [Leptotrichia wadei]KXB60455.1 transposase [Leptotrichia wadei]